MMMSRCKLLCAVAAVVLFGIVVDSASARSFSASSQTLRALFFLFLREREVRERLEITGPFGTYRCALTLEGSLHARTISKVASNLIGYINRADMAECSTMNLFENRVLRETLPWRVQYRSFTGLLPNIGSLSISIIGFAMQIREGAFGIRCLGVSTATEPFILTYPREAGGLTSANASGTITTRCPELEQRVTFGGGTGTFAPTNITLI
jgi:hypothetical protein